MHKVSIKSDKFGKTRLFLDGVDISTGCLSFELSQEGVEGPMLSLTVSCKDIDVEIEQAEVTSEPPAGKRNA